MIFSLSACAGKQGSSGTAGDTQQTSAGSPAENAAQDSDDGPSEGDVAQPSTIAVFAPQSAVLFVMTAIDKYSKVRPDVTITASFDTSMVNTEKVMSGYRCDLLVADDPQILDFIDVSCDANANPYKLDLVNGETRVDICSAETADGVVYFSCGILKKSTAAAETQKFVDFMLGLGDEAYADFGYTKAE